MATNKKEFVKQYIKNMISHDEVTFYKNYDDGMIDKIACILIKHEGRKGKAYIEFDDDATTSAMYVPADEGYYDTDIWIGTKISVIRATSTNVRVRGIIWGR